MIHIEKRQSKDRIVLKTGEGESPSRSLYFYRWTDANSVRHTIYAKTIKELRDKEKLISLDKKKLTRQFIFRSRMYEQSFTKEDFDPFVMRQNMKELVSRYDHTAGQIRFFSVVADELIYPLLNHTDTAGVKATVRLICSETSSAHMLLLDLEHLDQDPLHSGYLDELNTRLLEAGCQYLISKRSENGWEVAMQL